MLFTGVLAVIIFKAADYAQSVGLLTVSDTVAIAGVEVDFLSAALSAPCSNSRYRTTYPKPITRDSRQLRDE